MADQPEALRLADALDNGWCPQESPKEMLDAAAELRRLAGVEAERDALRADAERYRWLRKYLSTKDMPILCGRGVRDEPDERDAIDAAIDAATKGGSNG